MDNGGASGTIGVVIRTLNESELIGSCLEKLQAQRGDFDLDVLVVDSGSTDTTVEIAQSHGARIATLSPGDFDYSKALNLGIDRVRGEIVVSISAHAIPVDDGWLERVAAHFADPQVAGVFTRQVPWPGSPWQEVHRLEHQFGPTQRTYSRGEEADVVFSNAASAIRRAAWSDQRFTLPAVEDIDWAQRVVSAGWEIVYEPDVSVFHSHHEDPRAQAQRLIDINRVRDSQSAPRTRRRTLHEAAGMLRRDSRMIFGLNEPFVRKLSYLGDLARTVWYYFFDFSRGGTTAERRREDSR
jgi:glycosyltransferase involved in cell wall biosynthesis